jgi:hypothetical protein
MVKDGWFIDLDFAFDLEDADPHEVVGNGELVAGGDAGPLAMLLEVVLPI